jgi:hypothetical protein
MKKRGVLKATTISWLFEDPFLLNFVLCEQLNVYFSPDICGLYSIYHQGLCLSLCPNWLPPPPQASVSPPWNQMGRGASPGQHSLAGKGAGPIRTSGEKALHSVYSVPVTLCSM